jgi:hypothetical protein
MLIKPARYVNRALYWLSVALGYEIWLIGYNVNDMLEIPHWMIQNMIIFVFVSYILSPKHVFRHSGQTPYSHTHPSFSVHTDIGIYTHTLPSESIHTPWFSHFVVLQPDIKLIKLRDCDTGLHTIAHVKVELCLYKCAHINTKWKAEMSCQ